MTTLYDSTDPTQIPKGAAMVAGYVGGKWPTFARLAGLFPDAIRISIAIDASEDADVLDVENGDAVPADVPAWVERQRARGADPTIYCSRVSAWPAVQAAVTAASPYVAPPHYWIADYTGVAHLVPGSSATQWTDAGPYDISETDGVWHSPAAPTDTTTPPEVFDMQFTAYDPVDHNVWATDESGDLYCENGEPFIQGLNQHPEWQAGEEESAGLNPCVGISYWGTPGGVDGILYFTKPAGGKGGWAGTPYSTYRFLRNGTPA